jgi:hypothetical protein
MDITDYPYLHYDPILAIRHLTPKAPQSPGKCPSYFPINILTLTSLRLHDYLWPLDLRVKHSLIYVDCTCIVFYWMGFLFHVKYILIVIYCHLKNSFKDMPNLGYRDCISLAFLPCNFYYGLPRIVHVFLFAGSYTFSIFYSIFNLWTYSRRSMHLRVCLDKAPWGDIELAVECFFDTCQILNYRCSLFYFQNAEHVIEILDCSLAMKLLA